MNLIRILLPTLLAMVCGSQFAMAADSTTSDKSTETPSASTEYPGYILAPTINEQKYPRLTGGARDIFPTYNRGMWWFDYDIMDKHVFRPVVHGYVNWVPHPVRQGVNNVLFNLSEPNHVVNNLLLGEVKDSGVSLARFGVNSTIGVLGIFDVAQRMGMDRHEMTMATVLGKAKMSQGPYFMVPLAGPTTLRNTVGTVIDNLYWPYSAVDWPVTATRYVLEALDSRSQLVDQEGLVDNAFDPYITARDFYLQYQQGKVDNGKSLMDNPTKPSAEDQEVDKYLDEIDQ